MRFHEILCGARVTLRQEITKNKVPEGALGHGWAGIVAGQMLQLY